MLAAGQRYRAERFRFVALAVADEAPHLAIAVVHQAAVLLVFHHVRLVDRLDRTEPHRHRRELPVVRHQPRVRVGRQAAAIDLAAEVVELRLVEPAFEKGARIHARRAMALVVDQVAGVAAVGAAEEIIEADVVQRRAEEKLEIWPPRPSSLSLARITMASAFQRISERMRRSMNRSPGMAFLRPARWYCGTAW